MGLNLTPASTTDKSTAKLTHRVHLNDPEVTVDPALWNYNAAGTALTLTGGFTANDIYEFSYIAKDPEIVGLGFAAVRDLNSWIKYGTAAEGNPMPNYVQRIYTEISSQPGRLLNDFRTLGFNEDESGRKVLDGIMNWISAGSGINMNYRFSQSNRTERNRQDHRYPENLFPFANVSTTDPHTGKTDSRYRKCQLTNTCPLGVEIYSANEYWVKSASLLHTTPDGSTDLPDSPFSRNYFMTSMQHGTGSGTSRGNCQQFQNPLSSNPVQRALFLALDKWATAGVPAPASRVPRLADGTMTLPANTGFPTNIPDPFGQTPNGKVTYTGLKSTRYRFNMGAGFYDTGIPTINPPVISAGAYQVDPPGPAISVDGHPIYPSFAPKTDSDGNDIAGLKLVDVSVPLATYTGWALRAGAQANDGCEGSGQSIAFPRTAAERIATGDPRPSVEERYPTFDDYDAKVKAAMSTMIKDRTLLCEDSSAELLRLRQQRREPRRSESACVVCAVLVRARECDCSSVADHSAPERHDDARDAVGERGGHLQRQLQPDSDRGLGRGHFGRLGDHRAHERQSARHDLRSIADGPRVQACDDVHGSRDQHEREQGGDGLGTQLCPSNLGVLPRRHVV